MESVPEEVTPEEAQPMEEVDLDLVMRLMSIVRGLDPDTKQTINDFMKFNNSIERTNLPTTMDCQRIDYLLYAGRVFFPDFDDDPFTEAAETEAITYMPRQGEKSKQFVEMVKQTPTLAELQSALDYHEGGSSWRDRIFGRGGGE